MKIKIVLLSSGMIVGALMSASAAFADTFAPTNTSGFVKMYGSHSILTDVGTGANGGEYTGGGGGGKVNIWLGDYYGIQMDGNFDFFRNRDIEGTQFAGEMLLHAGWRDPQSGYFGGFGGLLSIGYSADSADQTQWVAGGEGAMYFDMITVFAQAGFMDQINSEDFGAFNDMYFVRGGVRYFANPNLKFEASGGLLSGDEYTDIPVDIPFWRVEAEHKSDDSRVSWFASYVGSHENEDTAEHTTHTVTGGIRIHFGQDTLLSVDRSGASQGFLDSRILQIAYDQ